MGLVEDATLVELEQMEITRRGFLRGTAKTLGIAAIGTSLPFLVHATSGTPNGVANSKYPVIESAYNFIEKGQKGAALNLLLSSDHKNSTQGISPEMFWTEPALYYVSKLVDPHVTNPKFFKDSVLTSAGDKNKAMPHFARAIDKYMRTFGGDSDYAFIDQIIKDCATAYVVACGRPENDSNELIKAISKMDQSSMALKFIEAPIRGNKDTHLLTAAWSAFLLGRAFFKKTGRESINSNGVIQKTESGFVAHYIEEKLKNKMGHYIRGPPKVIGIENV